MKITSPKLDVTNLSPNEKALLCCQTAWDLKDRGDYDGAQRILTPLWPGLGKSPVTKGLHPSVAAEVMLCVGVLTRSIGSRREFNEVQELAKNLITSSITYYESIADIKKVASARVELACCYWWAGELEEARIIVTKALEKLTADGISRAKALLTSAVIEWSASRHRLALDILTRNAPLFEKLNHLVTKGTYHNQIAIILRHLAKSENSEGNLRKAVAEFEKADHYFKQAKNHSFRANVKNNVGLILLSQGRLKDAHKYLSEARRLSVVIKDKVRISGTDESRAQVFIAEGKFKEAETLAKGAVVALDKSDHRGLLADALTTHGVALARLKRFDQALFTFQRAVEVAQQVGALNKAGIAALTLIEELDDLPADTRKAAYHRASEWLASSQSRELLLRLNQAARKVLLSENKCHGEDATERLLNKSCDLQAEVLRYEGLLIRQALAKVSGSVTRAAALLGMSYQGLAYVIEARHRDLLKERSPIRRRSRKD